MTISTNQGLGTTVVPLANNPTTNWLWFIGAFIVVYVLTPKKYVNELGQAINKFGDNI